MDIVTILTPTRKGISVVLLHVWILNWSYLVVVAVVVDHAWLIIPSIGGGGIVVVGRAIHVVIVIVLIIMLILCNNCKIHLSEMRTWPTLHFEFDLPLLDNI